MLTSWLGIALINLPYMYCLTEEVDFFLQCTPKWERAFFGPSFIYNNNNKRPFIVHLNRWHFSPGINRQQFQVFEDETTQSFIYIMYHQRSFFMLTVLKKSISDNSLTHHYTEHYFPPGRINTTKTLLLKSYKHMFNSIPYMSYHGMRLGQALNAQNTAPCFVGPMDHSIVLTADSPKYELLDGSQSFGQHLLRLRPTKKSRIVITTIFLTYFLLACGLWIVMAVFLNIYFKRLLVDKCFSIVTYIKQKIMEQTRDDSE